MSKPITKGGYLSKRAGMAGVELGIIGGVVIVLSVAIFFMVDPIGRKVAKNNEQRWKDVETISNAIADTMNDEGVKRSEAGFPVPLSAVDDKAHTIQVVTLGESELTCGEPCGDAILPFEQCTADLSALEGRYLHQIPVDPDATAPDTGYFVNIVNDTITVGACAPDEEQGGVPQIRLTRSADETITPNDQK